MSNETNMTPDTTGATGGEKFTPGPWHVSAYDGGWTCVREPGGVIIAKLSLDHEPNAYLLAAAPELYAALKAVRHYVEGQVANMGLIAQSDLKIVDSALAKAKGDAN